MKEIQPTVSLQERDRRLRVVKELMKARGLDCLIVFGLNGKERFDAYLTYEPARGIVVVPFEGEITYLVWSPLAIATHIQYLLRGGTSWVDHWRIGTSGPALVDTLNAKGFDSGTIGVVGLEYTGPGEGEGYIPFKTWSHILEHLPNATFVDVSRPFAELVLVKSEEELALLRHSARIGEMACEAMLEATKPGVSESEIYAVVMSVLFRNGASTWTSLILESGIDNPSWGAPLWTYQAQPPRILQKGDMVEAELFPFYGGVTTQQQMSVALKPVHPVNQECAGIARHSYEVGLKALRPGKTFDQVADAMERPLAEAGCWHLCPLIHSMNPQMLGGGTGTRIQNLPGIEKYGPMPKSAKRRGGDLIIKPGMVFELEPNACRGKHRVVVGSTVIVTKDGAEELNTLGTEMQVVE